MKSTDFYDLVSGRRRGIGPSVLRGLLALAEGPYRAAVWWRNRRYDRVESLVHRVEAPVVSVGNLTLGGSGKTPMVKWIARRLREEGVRVTLLSRGYGSTDGGPNDEALELEQALPDVPHLQNPDRVAAARVAIDELAAQALVLDDGFQHRRIGRDLDLVLLDATAPFGYGRVFPRGALRESVASLRRADLVCLTRSDLIDETELQAIRERVARVAPDAGWCESVVEPTRLVGVDESGGLIEQPLDSLAGKRVAAFCGVGNPGAFRRTLGALGAEVEPFTEFPDHHAYGRDDIERLTREASDAGAAAIVCTHKDLVKVGVENLGGIPLRAIEIELRFRAGEELVRERLAPITARALSRSEDWE
ncbi:Tetraacyldisaccharide 4'-kinase [Planctomycetes bacterium MalM25]|nr:Tetraacyldisaccharide 4'-kinase [Planctomycetes bacterium MalM25]